MNTEYPDIAWTSDTHFNHEKMIQYQPRPFKDRHDMESTIIERWNSRVGPGTLVYHLGDFGLSYGKKSSGLLLGIFNRLNGHKFLIKGNHDRKEVLRLPWAGVFDYKELTINLPSGKQPIVMFHYPIRSWHRQGYGSWHLHGHCHNNLPDYGGKIMDVGVDARGYAPVSVQQVESFMAKREILAEDHHAPRVDGVEH